MKGWQFWSLNAVALLTLILVVLNIYTFVGNRSLQAEVNQRQQFINDSIKLSQLNTQLIRALASLAARKDDQQLKKLLALQGITFTVNQMPASSQGKASKRDRTGSKERR